MEQTFDLSRFIPVHGQWYDTALREIKGGKKESHWMWFIFPQLRGLGRSSTSVYFALSGTEEAAAFLRDPYLGGHLKEISRALLGLATNDPHTVFDFPDDKKLCSCMTLFAQVSDGDPVFQQVLDKFFGGKPDGITLGLLQGKHRDRNNDRGSPQDPRPARDATELDSTDGNIDDLRKRYPDGLHFVVGDTHGQTQTLIDLMEKIRFDPEKDHVYFVGDYNAGGNVHMLLRYMSAFYQADPVKPGFHMIRGNHEREHYPVYTLANLPDIYVVRMPQLTYFIAHAGMVRRAFQLICTDLNANGKQSVFAYGLDDCCVAYDAPLRQVMHSGNGLYEPRRGIWPAEQNLRAQNACIIHGHSPYSFFRHTHADSYGGILGKKLFWTRQHVFFSEDLQSFNIDSDVKGRCANGQTYRGLSCVCLETTEEIAAQNIYGLTVKNLVNAPNCVFGVPLVPCRDLPPEGDINNILNAAPKMRRITLNSKREPCFI